MTTAAPAKCQRCCAAPPEEGRTRCARCRERHNYDRRRHHARVRYEKGLDNEFLIFELAAELRDLELELDRAHREILRLMTELATAWSR